jgi:hypothetical protein
MPKTRLGITDKIAGGTNTKKNVWPFVVSWFLWMIRIVCVCCWYSSNT